MKQSNTLLLSLVVIWILFVAAIPITLRYKLDHGEFSPGDASQVYEYNEHHFNGLKTIVVHNVHDCTIIPGETQVLEIEKADDGQVHFHRLADTLFVEGGDASRKAGQKIRLCVSGIGSIKLFESNILLRGSLALEKAQSYEIKLVNSKIATLPVTDDYRVSQFINRVSVVGSGNAIVDFAGPLTINSFAVADASRITSDEKVLIPDLEITYHNKANVKSRSRFRKIDVTAQ